MSKDDNRWKGYEGDDLVRPVTTRKARCAVDRDAEYAVVAEALGREWRRSGRVLTPAIMAGLDALAAR